MNILVSACLLGVCCRYDGAVIAPNQDVLALHPRHRLIPICPETLGGLCTPRPPAERTGERVMTQAGADVTRQYVKGAHEALHLAQLFGCTHAILKDKSPSCGHGVIYDGTFSRTLVSGSGIAAQLLEKHGLVILGSGDDLSQLQ